jgi:hypothetical protein
VNAGVLRFVSILLITLSALFFGAFPDSAQAHGMHPNSVSQKTALTISIEDPDIVKSIDSVQDVAVKGCGLNCCSVSGCGYVPLRLEELFLPKISTSVRQIFNILPWVKNPLDSLLRPPRAFA